MRRSRFPSLLLLAACLAAIGAWSSRHSVRSRPAAPDSTSPTAAAPVPEHRGERDAPAVTPHTDFTPAPTPSEWSLRLSELKRLAAQDPDRALSALTTFSDSHELKAAAVAVLPTIARSEPAKALKAAWKLGVGRFADHPGEQELLDQLAREWARLDLAEGLAWAESLPADEESRRDYIVKGFTAELAKHSPALSMRLVDTRIATGTTAQMDAAVETVRHWASQDYPAAIAWVAVLPLGALRDRAIEELSKIEPPPDPSSLRRG